jgi:hypothetical protein
MIRADKMTKEAVWGAFEFSAEEVQRLESAARWTGEKGKWRAREYVGLFLWRRWGWDGLGLFPWEYLPEMRVGVIRDAERVQEAARGLTARNVEERIAAALLAEVLKDARLEELAGCVFVNVGVGARELCGQAVSGLGFLGCRTLEKRRRLMGRWVAVPDLVLREGREWFERVALDALKGRKRRARRIEPWLVG